jgi:hypothetical protein
MVRFIQGRKVFDLRDDGATYTGEKAPGDLSGWDRLISDPNKFLSGTYDLISQSCVSLYHTYGPAQGAVNKHTDYAIGDGLYFRSQPDYGLLGFTQEYAEDWARRFQKLIYYKMTLLNLFQKQNAAFRGALVFGDSVTYFVRDSDGLDIVEFPGTEIDSLAGEPEYPDATLGIVHDNFYRRKGFYNKSGAKIAFSENGRQNAVQFYLKRLPRQLRGYPLVYAAISHSKNDDRFEDATLAAAVLEAMMAIVTEGDDPESLSKEIENLVKMAKKTGGGKIKAAMASMGNAMKLGTGNILNIRTGGKVTALDKKTPSGTYPSFKEWRLKQFGMATNTPPEVVASEYSTSYTAHRGALNDFIKTWSWEREEFARIWGRPVLRELAGELILSGAIDAPGFFTGGPIIQEAYLKGIWLGPVPGYLNPLQEISAKLKSIDGALTLRSDEMFNLSGSDYADVIEKWMGEEKRFKEAKEEDKEKLIAAQDEINVSKTEETQE